MQRRFAIVAGVALLATGLGLAAAPPKPAAVAMVVYKSPTCGCCRAWVDHVQASGFRAEVHDVSDSRLAAVEHESRVPDDLASCHTAMVGGYIVEGHVPADDITRMLRERPAIAGISVAGMPMGSPGMEQGGATQPFTTMAFTKDGKKSVFARH
jgi:hypothetical protein